MKGLIQIHFDTPLEVLITVHMVKKATCLPNHFRLNQRFWCENFCNGTFEKKVWKKRSFVGSLSVPSVSSINGSFIFSRSDEAARNDKRSSWNTGWTKSASPTLWFVSVLGSIKKDSFKIGKAVATIPFWNWSTESVTTFHILKKLLALDGWCERLTESKLDNSSKLK